MNPPAFRICRDGSVEQYPLPPAEKRSTSGTIYLIESTLIPKKTTKCNYDYHTCKVLNVRRQPVEDNILVFAGIECRLEEIDKWETNIDLKHEFGINGIVLVAHIIDRLDKERKVLFDNDAHNGSTYRKLIRYAEELSRFGTHEAMKEIWNLNLLIKKKEDKIDQMAKAYQAAFKKRIQNSSSL
ncbi:hypothetical protein GCM10022408_10100 [Hymenobacter fastidiosus]|uniref:Uncharacterized protein n=1 Tax=Hymenobacter fastidiosus TaxID=486264 RepID=A0ABP7RR40_9BACT